MKDNKYLDWEKRVYLLDLMEIKFLEVTERKKIPDKIKKKIRSFLDDLWIKVWDYYPDKNESVDKAFKKSFVKKKKEMKG